MTNLLEYLEKTVLEFPDKCAYADENYSLTFREVYEQARSVGTALLNDGISKEPVVVFMPKEPKTITAFLGALYAGAFYVPIDEEMPKYRIELILKMLEARAVICDETSAGTIKKYGFSGKIYIYDEMICTEEDNAKLVSARNKFIDTDPAYVVFTSGSTGVPKGVVACHRSVIDYIENLSAVLQVDSDTIFGNQAPLYVDACLKEIYPTLKCGATAVIIPKQHFMFPMQLVDFLNEKRINTICWVVPALTMISSLGVLEKKIPLYLKTVAFGSEVFPVKQFNLWQKYVPDARYINLYGPTEATGMSCYYIVDRHFGEDEVIPIGRPFANTDILLLDDSGKPVACGEKGEIYIRGTSVTLGYYRQFEKTAESFVQNPLNDMYPEIVYKTGDLGYYNERGELMFASRKDYQIKHMGHRIELGEIEMAVNGCEGIESCCCVYDEEKKKICLFYTGNAEKDILAVDLREKLPRYMLPNRYEKLEKLQLTLNGKIDRKALLQWKN